MDWWMIALLVSGVGLLGLRLWAGPAPTRHEPFAPPEPAEAEQLWTPDALARLGTPETVADLVAQGRADELRGLGYRGELRPEE